ncbi:MAG: hypothetical protein P1U68_17330 [Verrucomicrobiales bacterium]|nr:hypothetical protein [Verrucomicrobiales bacterium]
MTQYRVGTGLEEGVGVPLGTGGEAFVSPAFPGIVSLDQLIAIDGIAGWKISGLLWSALKTYPE